jgi:hypothetical protein
VPGFWAEAPQAAEKHDVTYLPKPPDPPETAAPAAPPNPDSFYVPAGYVWTGERYAWRAGYWARVEPGYVWVPGHFRWTPYGYVYIAGYWDLAVARRGVIYAPVVIDPDVVTVGFVYTPCYVVPSVVVVDAFFVRPCYCHYYYGDYYEACYRERGFECAIVYSRRHYDSVIVYERWEHRSDPRWEVVQVNVYNDRCAGRAACPPRTLAAQEQAGRSVVVPASRYAAVSGVKMARVDATERLRVREQAQAIQQVGLDRRAAEAKMSVGAPAQPRVASVQVPRNYPAPPPPPRAPGGGHGGSDQTGHQPDHGTIGGEDRTKHQPDHGSMPPPKHPGDPTPPPDHGSKPPAGPPPRGGQPPVKPPPSKPMPPPKQPPPKQPPGRDSSHDR